MRPAADLRLSNGLVDARWSIEGGRFRALRVNELSLSPDICTLVFRDGTTLGTSALRVTRAPRYLTLAADRHAARLAGRVDGRALIVELADPDGRFRLTIRAELRE